MDESTQRPRNNRSQDSRRQTTPKQARSSATNENSASRDSSLRGTPKSTPRTQSENREHLRHGSNIVNRATDRHRKDPGNSYTQPVIQYPPGHASNMEQGDLNQTYAGSRSTTYYDQYGDPMVVQRSIEENRHTIPTHYRNEVPGNFQPLPRQHPQHNPSSQNQQHHIYQSNEQDVQFSTYQDDFGRHTQGNFNVHGDPIRQPAYYHASRFPGTSVDDSMVPTSQKTGSRWDGIKDLAREAVSVATFGHFGNKSNVQFHNSPISIQAMQQQKNEAKQENLKCSKPMITQPEGVSVEYISGLTLKWTVPKPEYCDLAGLVVTIMSDSGTVFEDPVKVTTTTKTVPKKTLKCGTRYRVFITTVVKHCDGEEQRVNSDVETFVTRLSRPKIIRIECDEEWADVQWSTCRGAEKFSITIFSVKDQVLAHNESLGTEFSCKFKIENTRGIRLGQEYLIEVVAIRNEWESHSGKEKFFFGNSDSPKGVFAKIIDGTNNVQLTWDRPGWWFSYEYIVEAILESGHSVEKRTVQTNSTQISQLKGGMSYTFRVATIGKNSQQSLWSTSNVIKTETCTIKVDKFWVEENEDDPAHSLDCVWDQAQDATRYKIRCKGPDKVSIATVGSDTTKYTLRGLVPNTEYEASIKAEDSRGYGPYTDGKNKLTAPGKPTDVRLRVTSGNQIAVSFTEALCATGHKVTLSANEDSDKVIWVIQGRGAEPFTNLADNTEYWATVAAVYGEVDGGKVRTDNVITAPKSPSVRDITSTPDENHCDSVFALFVRVDDNTEQCQARIKCNDENDGDDENIEDNVTEMKLDRDTKRAFLLYKCFYKGAAYSVRVRVRNRSEYSEWSERKLIKTAPKKIDAITIFFNDGKLLAKWKDVRHTNSNTIVLFEANERGSIAHDVKSPFSFQGNVGHGLEYFCQIYPENDAGRGRTTTSNTVLLPLEPPRDLSMRDEISHATFTWKPSTGMRSAKIRFSNSEFDQTENITTKHQWSSPYITYGEVYTLTVWARNGQAQSKDFLSKKYVAAPSDVIARRNALKPETSLDVEIITKYTGPFLLTWFDRTKKKTKLGIFERCFTIENLKPATEYMVHASCLYGENQDKLSAKSHSDEVMTIPEKVTGVLCSSGPTGYQELTWDGCGNDSVEYTITWSRNNVAFKQITTDKTSWKFKNLKSGNYTFFISAGGGKKSDACSITVLESPQLDVEVLSCRNIRVVFTSSEMADKYSLFLKDDSTGKLFDTVKCKYVLGEGDFSFKKGVSYSAIGRAYSGEHSGAPTRKEFIVGLENPTDLTCELNHYDAQRPVKFTWNNSREMFNAKIQLREIDNSLVVEEFTSNSFWEYWGLKPNKTYELFLWPGDGRRFFYDDCLRHKFTTAPGPPRSVRRNLNKTDRTSKFDIEIDSDYSGPFLTEIVKMDGELEAEHSGCEKSFTMEGLSPGTLYYISARCVFEDYISEKTYV